LYELIILVLENSTAVKVRTLLKIWFQSSYKFKTEKIHLVITCVTKPSAGDMVVILPDTLAKVLTLTAVEFSNTSIINSYKSESLLSGTGDTHCFKSQRILSQH
jgi:hypothetical protein